MSTSGHADTSRPIQEQGHRADSASAPSKAHRVWWTLQRREAARGALYMLPLFVVFCAIVIYPFIYGIHLSFYSYPILSHIETFVGLEQFRRTLSATGGFLHSLRVTLIWVTAAVGSQMVIGVSLALLLNQRIWGRALVRGLTISPYVVPAVAAVTVWQWMFNDVYGIVNDYLQNLGLTHTSLRWLDTPNRALLSLIVVGTWRLFPFVTIAALARLQSIPKELYQAASVDGAGALSQFWKITLPELRGVLVVTMFLRFVWDFNNYDIPALLTNGGPAGATQTLPLLIYNQLFNAQDGGLAAASATLMVAGLTVLTLTYFLTTRRIHEGTI